MLYFYIQNASPRRRTSIRSPKQLVRDDDFIFGLSPNRRGIGRSNSGISCSNLELRISW